MYEQNYKLILPLMMLMTFAVSTLFFAGTVNAQKSANLPEHEYAKITRHRVEKAMTPGATKADITLAEGSLTGLGWFIIYGNDKQSATQAKQLNNIVTNFYNGTPKMDVVYMKHTSEAYGEMLNLGRFDKRKPANPSDEYSRITGERVIKALSPGATDEDIKLAEGSLCALGWMALYGNDANSKTLANEMATNAFNQWRGSNEVYMLHTSTAYGEMLNLGRFKLNAVSVIPTNPGSTNVSLNASDSVEEQYWDAVKNSTRPQDFQEYLKNYPRGKYAAIARQKMTPQTGGINLSPNPINSTQRNNAQFLNSWAADVRVGLPEKVGDFQLTDAMSQCESGCQEKLDPGDGEELALIFTTNRYTVQNNFTNEVVPALKPYLIPEYCKTEGMKKDIRLVVFVMDSNGRQLNNFFVFPKDCAATTTQNTYPQNPTNIQLTDADFLNKWAGEVRAGLPESIAGFQLTTAWSRCPAGCQEKDSSPYLLLKFNAEAEQQYADISDLEKQLKPALVPQYCKSDAIRRNIMMGVFFDNRAQNQKVNFWVSPKECSMN